MSDRVNDRARRINEWLQSDDPSDAVRIKTNDLTNTNTEEAQAERRAKVESVARWLGGEYDQGR